MINQNINFETPNKIGDENESSTDLNNEDYIKKVFESGTEEELEKITNQYDFTPEQIKLFSHFAKLRKNILDEMHQQIEDRRKNRPIATEDELSMGAYQESIEPQVRQTVFDLRKKGYATYGSGFNGFDNQAIYFEKHYLENFKIPAPIVDKFKEQKIIIEIKPDRIKLIFEKEFTQEEISSFWQEIESYFPSLEESAPPCQLNQAISFRERQKGLTIGE